MLPSFFQEFFAKKGDLVLPANPNNLIQGQTETIKVCITSRYMKPSDNGFQTAEPYPIPAFHLPSIKV